MSGEYSVVECENTAEEKKLKCFYDEGGLAKAKAYARKRFPNARRRTKKKNFNVVVIDFRGHVFLRLK
jgi:hypothetical protein